MFKSFAVGLIVLMAATSAPAAAKNDEAPPPNKKQKMICKNDAPTGSRLKKRTCLTAEQWDEIRAATQKEIGGFNRAQSGVAPEAKNPFGP